MKIIDLSICIESLVRRNRFGGAHNSTLAKGWMLMSVVNS